MSQDISAKLAAKDVNGRGLYQDRQFGLPLPLPPVAGRLMMPPQGVMSVGAITRTYRTSHPVRRPTTLVRLMWVNSGFSGQLINPFTLTASIQGIPASSTNTNTITTIQLKFNGATSIVVPANGYAISDPIWLRMKPKDGAFFLVRTCCASESASNNWPNGMSMTSAYDGQSDGDQTMNSSATFTSGGLGYHPSLICSYLPGGEKSYLGAGDSIMDGAGDRVNNRGFFEMFIADKSISGNRAAVPGERGSLNITRMQNRWQYSQAATHVLWEHGTNDIFGGDSLSTVQSTSIEAWAIYKQLGKKVIQSTILPVTTSTDTWRTVSGQTVKAQESVRVAFNIWLRQGAPCIVDGDYVTPTTQGTLNAVPCPYLDGIVDVCKPVEVNSSNVLTENGGFWKSGLVLKTGTVTSAAIKNLVDSNGGFNSINPGVGGAMVVITSGTGSGQANLIDGNQSNTQLNMQANWGVTPDSTSAYQIIDIPTPDGLHPSSNSHRRISWLLGDEYEGW